jgi:hypothetical protein
VQLYIKQTKRFTPQWSHFIYWILLFSFVNIFSIVNLPPRIWQFCTVITQYVI